MRTISSRQHAIVRAYRELAAEPDPGGARLLLDGVHLVRDAQAAALRFESVAVASSRLASATDEGEIALALERAGVDVVAADVQDPGNLGSLLRVAEAGGVTGVIVCGESANPFSWKALRGSMGSVLRLPVTRNGSIDAVMADLRKADVKTIAAVPREGADPDATDWSERIALLLGGEGPGLDPRVVALCDERVSVPMAPPVESLNVAVAGAILIYAARRGRS